MSELKPILNSFSNIKYFAVSNIDSKNDLVYFLDYISNNITVVPKIESQDGVKNIKEITELLGTEKIVMLDHDDLYSSILRSNEDPNNFQNKGNVPYLLQLKQIQRRFATRFIDSSTLQLQFGAGNPNITDGEVIPN